MSEASEKPKIRLVINNERVSPNDVVATVAGIYITEFRADCVIGELVKDSPKTATGKKAPKTKNSDRHERIHEHLDRGSKTPEEFLIACVEWLEEMTRDNRHDLQAVSIACFGPFESLRNPPDVPTKESPYGKLAALPNYAGWGGLPIYYIVKEVFRAIGNPKLDPLVRIYTDVDAAAFGEYWYHYRDAEERSKYIDETTIVFLKFSRSVSGGIAHRGDIWRGRMHPMMSIIPPRRFSEEIDGNIIDDEFKGSCPFHQFCIEGAIGEDALEKRTGLAFRDIPKNDDLLWRMVAYYIASLCVSATATVSPSHIFLGGKTLRQASDPEFATEILEMVRGYFYKYISFWNEQSSQWEISPDYKELRDVDNYIRLQVKPPQLIKEDDRRPIVRLQCGNILRNKREVRK